MNQDKIKRATIARAELPRDFPTHTHSPQFWEQLGRTIAMFGFLEEVLGKAIFAFTATREYSPEEIEQAYESWQPQLERALKDTLFNLAESFGKAVRNNPAATITNINDLVEDIKNAANIRNVLCHGSWRTPDENGASIPFFFNKRLEKFDTAIDIEYLNKTRNHVLELVCAVINSVTHMGWQFPGGAGPGTPIL